MATKKKRSTTKKKSSAPLVKTERKQEIMGLVLMVLAFLVALAIATYNTADADLARSFSLERALNPGTNRAANALGLVGAKLAWILVPGFLGYTSLLFPILFFAWGYVVFRHRTSVYLPLLSVLTLIGAFVLAALFGWFDLVAMADLGLYSGQVGLGIAGWMERVFGAIGSFVLLLVLLAVTVLLVIDHDIQRSLDRLEEGVRTLRTSLSGWRTRQREKSAARRAERERLRAERDAAREKQRQERERKERERKERERKAREAGAASKGTPKPTPRSTPSPAPPPQPAPRPASVPTVNDRFRDRPAPPAPRPAADATPTMATSEATPKPAARTSTRAHVEPELKVRERIEEEKADSIERDADTAEADLPFEFPTLDLLDEADDDAAATVDYEELETNKRILLDKLDTYNIQIDDINAIVGPTVTQYELTPAAGVKISRITSLEDDLAMAMAARGIRMIAPIPGKSAIGVEIPNRHRELVRIRDIIGTARFRDANMDLPIALGKTIEGEVYLQDLTKMPHLLVAGATGSGKSVGINGLITGLLYACHPSNLKFVMIDPKKIELQQYRELVGHYIAMPEDGEDPVITDFEDALSVLKSCEREMERRYDLLSKASVRGIKEYNRKIRDGKLAPEHRHLPYVVVIVDELADLMMTAGKEIEGPIARLAQMARAVGIHLVLATQRPSVDVITGLIKANFPSRVAFQVASKIDSRTILDQNGAEGLVGNGDLLYMSGSHLLRIQGPFVSIDEVDRLVEAISHQPGPGPYLLPPADVHEASPVADAVGIEEADELFADAARIIVQSQQGSVSLLQRKLSVGYTRAARIVDQLEEAGIVGPFVGSKARDVLVSDLQQLEDMLSTEDEG